MDLAFAHETVRLPRLAVVGEVTALQRLEVHPEVPVVVLDHEAARRRAGDDHPAAFGHEHRRTHRGAPRVLEDDVGVGAGELADLLAETAPLGRVLLAGVVPERVALGPAVDDVFDAHVVEERGTLGRRHDAHRGAAAVEHVLTRVRTDATGGSPYEHGLALGHLRAVRAHDCLLYTSAAA